MIELVSESNAATLNFSELFGRVAPIHVDLGCGDGIFLQSLATQNPDWNFLGIEHLLRRVRKSDRKAAMRPNVRIIRSETMFLLKHLLPAGSVDSFYLLFPDPWPKRRHHRRRLVSQEFLAAIWNTLAENGCLYIATDHDNYFSAIRKLLNTTSGFVRSDREWELPSTTFERKFISAGNFIHRLALRKISPVT